MKKYAPIVDMNLKSNIIPIIFFAFLSFISLEYGNQICPKCKRIYPDVDSFGYKVNFCKYCKPPIQLKPIISKTEKEFKNKDNKFSQSLTIRKYSSNRQLAELTVASCEIGYPSHWDLKIVEISLPLLQGISLKTCISELQGFSSFDEGFLPLKLEKSIFLSLPAYIYLSPTRWFSVLAGGAAWGGHPSAGGDVSPPGTAMFLTAQGEIVSPVVAEVFYLKILGGYKKIWWRNNSSSQASFHIGLGVMWGLRSWEGFSNLYE